MINKNLDEINAVVDSSQKITAFGGLWRLKKFMERFGCGQCNRPGLRRQTAALGIQRARLFSVHAVSALERRQSPDKTCPKK